MLIHTQLRTYFKKLQAGAREIAPLVRCLLHKHEDLDLIPQNPYKTASYGWCGCNPWAGQAETGRSLGLVRHQTYPTWRSSRPMRNSLQKQGGQCLGNDHWGQSLTSTTYTFIHMCTCAPMHTHTNKNPKLVSTHDKERIAFVFLSLGYLNIMISSSIHFFL